MPIETSVVSGVVISTSGNETKILLMKRAKEGFWCHVAGKIESNEAAWQALVRELKEETGLMAEELYTAEYLEQFYESKKNVITLIPVFVVKVSSDKKITLNEEHSEFRWCSLQEAKSLAPFPNQKKLYDHVWQYFVEEEPSELMKAGGELTHISTGAQ
ncbi:DNA mismatch repair protein MutT [Motiliproteus sp. MSK22-1]|nr:DNA mismatch repair protein MutT [Motiliproteus sp. MSK22-1]